MAPPPGRQVLSDEKIVAIARLAAHRHLEAYPGERRTLDELRADALFGVAQALAAADSDDVGRVFRYAQQRAAGAVVDAWRWRTHERTGRPKRPRFVPLDDLSAAAVTQDATDRVDARDLAARGLAVMTPRQRRVVLATEVHGFTSDEVAEALGVTRSRVSQIRTAAFTRARAALEVA